MKKSVFSVDIEDAKSKTKAFQAVAGFKGLMSLSIDPKKKQLTVIGEMDPVDVTMKLRKQRKLSCAHIETVEPIKEDGGKKDDKGKEKQELDEIVRAHNEAYYRYYWQPCPYPHCEAVHDSPGTCVIS